MLSCWTLLTSYRYEEESQSAADILKQSKAKVQLG